MLVVRKAKAWAYILAGLVLVALSLVFGGRLREIAAHILLRFHKESVSHLKSKASSPDATPEMVAKAKAMAEQHRMAAVYEYSYTDTPVRDIVKKLKELEL